MAVYREGFKAVEEFQKSSVQIFEDACDYGVPTKKGDRFWNLAKQGAEMYGDEETRHAERYETGRSVYIFRVMYFV